MTHPVIDALDASHPRASIGTDWRLMTDGVMGGISDGALRREAVEGRPALRLTGTVRLDNNGGFVQAALDLAPGGGTLDAGGWTGIEADIHGNGAEYGLHLRTPDLTAPWQSFRVQFLALPEWHAIRLPFAGFVAHRTAARLDPARLRRLGLVAIGRAFQADLAMAGLRLYR